MKCCRYVSVQLDVHLLLIGDFLIAGLDLRADPVRESVFENGGDDVANPHAADFVELLAVRKVAVDVVGLPPAELLDLLQGQRLVVRHGDVLDFLRENLYMGNGG